MVTAVNPVLCGFYPDPSICRVDKEFYLVSSSFSYFPGVPVFHSRDLVHWEQIGNILDREEQLPLAGNEISQGIYAPSIRYHNGTYYMITTNVSSDDVSSGGNFIVTAEKPEGPWSAPYYLGDEANGIDPSLFFDTDGRCYYTGTRPNPEGVRYNGDWEIWIQELDLKQMKLTGESMAIWKGALKDVIWPEGPHLYKIGEYYYLIHAEGGTGLEHSISVARSKKLFQWFEGCPRNPVFTHRNLGMDYPVINAGHGDLVDDGNGNWYIIMLASRICKRHSNMGRESFLAKVIWEDGWPVISPGTGKLEDSFELPFIEECRFANEISHHDNLHFYDVKLDDRLIGIQTRNEEQYSLKARKGFLRLYTRKEKIEEKDPSYLGIRQKDYCFEVQAGMEFLPQGDESAGLVYYQNHDNHLRMEIKNYDNETFFVVTAHIHGKDNIISRTQINNSGLIEITMRAENQTAYIYVKTGGVKQMAAENVDLIYYTTEEAGGFVGCTIGMYASSNGSISNNYADFAWLSYNAV